MEELLMGKASSVVEVYRKERTDYHYSEGSIFPCKCDGTERLGVCEKHDRELLYELSEELYTDQLQRAIGVYLEMDDGRCKDMFEMLYDRWYKSYDSNKMKENGLKELYRILRHKHVGQNHDFAIDVINRTYPGCTGMYLGVAGHMLAFYGKKTNPRAGLLHDQAVVASKAIANIPTWMGYFARWRV